MNQENHSAGSIVTHQYSDGKYSKNVKIYNKDAPFKSRQFIKTFLPIAQKYNMCIESYADIGCGAGDTTKLVAALLKEHGYNKLKACGFDVLPDTKCLTGEDVTFYKEDFCQSGKFFDLVTLFDVVEHVPDPIDFIKQVSRQAGVIVFHIPLDNSLQIKLRDKYKKLLINPAHLTFLDTPMALNLLSFSGLRVLSYDYTFGFYAPSGHSNLTAKIFFPLRAALSFMSPYLLSKTLGGCSLMVVALTPIGLEKFRGYDI